MRCVVDGAELARGGIARVRISLNGRRRLMATKQLADVPPPPCQDGGETTGQAQRITTKAVQEKKERVPTYARRQEGVRPEGLCYSVSAAWCCCSADDLNFSTPLFDSPERSETWSPLFEKERAKGAAVHRCMVRTVPLLPTQANG